MNEEVLVLLKEIKEELRETNTKIESLFEKSDEQAKDYLETIEDVRIELRDIECLLNDVECMLSDES